MNEIIVIKKKISHNDIGLSALFMCYNSGVDFLNRIKDNQMLKAIFKKERNVKHHRKYFAICSLIADNSNNPELDNRNKVDEYVRIKTGFVEFRIIIDGAVHLKTKSLQFKKTDQFQFEDFFNLAIPVFEEISGLSYDQLEKNHFEYL